jgi:hypothetical protein
MCALKQALKNRRMRFVRWIPRRRRTRQLQERHNRMNTIEIN